MTFTEKDLLERSGPKYRAIAALIGEHISAGALPPGTKLPPQRDLAYDLGVTLGTVTRAYRELEARGLVGGEVGRGTFVKGGAVHGDAATSGHGLTKTTPVDVIYDDGNDRAGGWSLASNYSITAGVGELMAQAAERIGAGGMGGYGHRGEVFQALSRYQYRNGLKPHREAGAAWLEHLGQPAQADELLITPGAQAGTMVAFMALTQPGDTILTEVLTWPGLMATAGPLGLNVKGLAIDDDGLVPDAFEKACRETAPKLLYLLPTLHNPTASVMPEERRRAIAAIAEKYQVPVVEDDVYGFLLDNAPPPVRAFCPDHGVLVNGLSKSVTPGLRVGYVQVAEARMNTFIAAMRCSFLMTSPVSVEIASEMIRGGEAAEMVARQRREVARRQTLMANHLGSLPIRTHPASLHAWIPAPAGESETTFRTKLLERGLYVTPGSAFATPGSTADDLPSQTPHVRICLGAEAERHRLEEALAVFKNTYVAGDEPAVTYV